MALNQPYAMDFISQNKKNIYSKFFTFSCNSENTIVDCEIQMQFQEYKLYNNNSEKHL